MNVFIHVYVLGVIFVPAIFELFEFQSTKQNLYDVYRKFGEGMRNSDKFFARNFCYGKN